MQNQKTKKKQKPYKVARKMSGPEYGTLCIHLSFIKY